jgi:hypothetical protein
VTFPASPPRTLHVPGVSDGRRGRDNAARRLPRLAGAARADPRRASAGERRPHTLEGNDPAECALGPDEDRPDFKSVACPTDGECLVGGKHGAKVVLASTTNDWDDYSLQTLAGIEGKEPTLSGFGCESAFHSVAVGATVLVGTRPKPSR